MIKHYPKSNNWISWYLADVKASILFPACKDLNEEDMQKFQSLSDNTNGQEGLGGFLQALAGYKKLSLQDMCRHIHWFVRKYSTEYRLAKQGFAPKYPRATKKDKKRGDEPKWKYKAPDDKKSNLEYTLSI